MSLVELIVTVMVSSLFLSLLALMFATALSTQKSTIERDRATGNANVVMAIVSSVRNATEVRVSIEGDRLDAAVVDVDGEWDCRTWAIDTSKGDFFAIATGPDPLPANPRTGNSLFAGVRGLYSGDRAFEVQSGEVGIHVAFTVGSETVRISDGATVQAVKVEEQPCWD